MLYYPESYAREVPKYLTPATGNNEQVPGCHLIVIDLST
jgi:hypothetical protein